MPASGSHRPSVLVVESEAIIRMETVLAIGDAGYTVLATGNADEALALLNARNEICAVFTEIRLPGHLNGLDLGHSIAERWPMVRLILTSSDPRWDNVPADWHYVQKPYGGAQVVAALKALPLPLGT